MKTYQDEDPLGLVPDELLHLLPGFLQRREREIPELFEMIRREEFDCIGVVGHRLKGHGTGYGFPIITALGAELEAAAGARDVVKIKHLAEELKSFTQALRGLLELREKCA